MKLPQKKWLSPEEAASLIVQKCDCSKEEALAALISAVIDQEVDAKAATSGASGNAALLDRDHFKRSGPKRDALGQWEISWQIRRESILHWLQVQLEPKLSGNRKWIGGRPTKWDWEGFWLEICRHVFEEGLPAKQADLVKTMQQWFVDKDDDHPAESEIKKRIICCLLAYSSFRLRRCSSGTEIRAEPEDFQLETAGNGRKFSYQPA